MRLKPHEVEAIKAAAREVFGPTAVVRVFGSRADDAKRGGDLDLYVEVDAGRGTLRNESRMLRLLEEPLDELHVDLLVRERDKPHRTIHLIALETGVPL